MSQTNRILSALLMSLSVGCASDLSGSGDGSGNGSGNGNGNGNGMAPVCEQSQPIQVVRPDPVDLLLVVDRSGSMGDALPNNGGIKLAVMKTALKQVVSAKDDVVNFGLFAFPSNNECGAGNKRVDPTLNADGAINPQVDSLSAGGGTPVAATMGAVLTYFANRPVNAAGRYVLLATDGEPTCLNNDGGANDETNAVAAIKAVADAGIKVYIIGFGNGVNGATIQKFATAGGTTTGYSAGSPAELQAAFDAITGAVQVPSCTLELQGAVPDANLLRVQFDGTEVPRDPNRATGWDYDSAGNSITFSGASCDQLQSGTVTNVAVDYGCGGEIL